MNIFRFLGDLAHLVARGILLQLIESTKSVHGLLLKTQVLYMAVFLTRYLDLLYLYVSLYNTLMKITYIATLVYTVYLIRDKYRGSIREHVDTFPVQYLLGGLAVLALLFNYGYHPTELLWSFSLWLECTAILPQLFVLQRLGLAEALTAHYIFALGLYRALYLPNWAYRWFVEGRFDKLAVFAGVVQTLIYLDFFYIYYTKVFKGKKFLLPV